MTNTSVNDVVPHDRDVVAVIGAGIAGLAAARELARAGFSVRVFDKGRGVSGRASTRYAEAGRRFDHGAQYFTTSDDRFARQADEWVAAGRAAEWRGKLAVVECDDAGRRWAEPPGARRRSSVCRG